MATYLQSDARNRAVRTFVQGLLTDAGIAVALAFYPVITDANGWGDFEWSVLGFLLAKTAGTAAMSYVMRVYLNRPGGRLHPPSKPTSGGNFYFNPLTGKTVKRP